MRKRYKFMLHHLLMCQRKQLYVYAFLKKKNYQKFTSIPFNNVEYFLFISIESYTT